MKTALRVLFTIHLTAVFVLAALSGSGFAEKALVTGEKSGTLTVVDLDTDRVVKTVKVGKVPHAIGVTPDEKIAYIGNRGSSSISVVDLAGDEPVRTIHLSHTIMNLEVSPDGRYVSANSRTAPLVSLIDTATNRVVRTIRVGEPAGERAAARGGIVITHDTWSPDSAYLYTPDRLNYRIVKIDVAQGRVVARTQMKTPTHHIIISRDGKTLYAANDGIEKTRLNPGITIIDATSMKIVKDIPLPLPKGEYIQGHHAAFDNSGRFLYFCNRGGPKGAKRGYTVGIIDAAAMKPVKTVRAGYGAGHAFFTPDGRHVFILNHHDNKISVLDAATMQPAGDIALPFPSPGSWGHSGCFSADGAYYYQVSEAEGVMVKVDARRLRFVKAVRVGDRPSVMTIIH